MVRGGQTAQSDEDTIRQMVTDAVRRLNQGDVTAIREFWDVNADYVGIGGQFVQGRQAIEGFFEQMLKAGSLGTETAAIEKVRFLSTILATVDGSWTVTGARDADGKELPPIRGRGFEIVQKKQGKWRFIATREMVVWKPQ
jgi:uncharacterized protein (TIGR02246 family)